VLAAALVLGVLSGTQTYLLVNAYPDNSIGAADAYLPALTTWLLWAAFTPLVFTALGRWPLSGPGWPRRLLPHLALGLAVAAARYVLDLGVGQLLPWMPARQASLTGFLFRVYPNFLTYAVLTLAVHAALATRRARERELRASRLEARLARVELEVLRAQLQPHFLFNTLNSIATLMHRDVPAAERMLVRLSDLLRRAIERVSTQEVTLAEELDLLEAYLDIQRIRFGERLCARVSMPAPLLRARVPSLLLQPLVENGIRHAVEVCARPVRIDVAGERDGERLRLWVEDDGPGMGEAADGVGLGAAPADNDRSAPGPGRETGREASPPLRNGVGLTNTRARLEGLYGASGRLHIGVATSGGGTRVEVSLPFVEGEEEP